MRENKLIPLLRAGKPVIGTFIKSIDPAVTELICMHDFEFIILDNEHTAMSKESMVNHIRACEIHDKTPLVRVRKNDPAQILQALDAGALGVQIPNLNNKEDAVFAAKCTKYVPEGFRGFASSQRCARYGLVNPVEYASFANANILTICYCETKDAVLNLDEILTVDGIDVIFIGPSDLSQWFGVRGEPNHPVVKSLMDDIIRKTLKAGKVCGTVAGSSAECNALIEKGVQFIVLSSDLSLIHESATKQLSGIKR